MNFFEYFEQYLQFYTSGYIYGKYFDCGEPSQPDSHK